MEPFKACAIFENLWPILVVGWHIDVSTGIVFAGIYRCWFFRQHLDNGCDYFPILVITSATAASDAKWQKSVSFSFVNLCLRLWKHEMQDADYMFVVFQLERSVGVYWHWNNTYALHINIIELIIATLYLNLGYIFTRFPADLLLLVLMIPLYLGTCPSALCQVMECACFLST